MSDSVNNIIQIKRGKGVPDGKLAPYELGISTDSDFQLYIGGPYEEVDGIKNYGKAQGIKVKQAENATNAINANWLTTARNIQTNLGSTAAVSFDGTEDVTPGVSGVLSLANGGLGVNASTDTGKTTARANLGITLANLNGVPTTRKINNKALSADITLTAADVSAVPTSRTVNGKALSANISLTASDVGARSSSWVPTLANLGITATATELNYVDGVKSAIQTQLNNITTRLGKIKYDQLLAQNSSVSSCTWTGTYDFVIGMATAGSAVDSRSTFILPSSFLGNSNSFQVADESYYTSFNTTANSITRKAGSGGVLKCLYGIKII